MHGYTFGARMARAATQATGLGPRPGTIGFYSFSHTASELFLPLKKRPNYSLRHTAMQPNTIGSYEELRIDGSLEQFQ